MTKVQKRVFIRNFTRQVGEHLVRQLDKIPEHWDGHELRELVADEFNRERSMSPTLADAYGKRRRQYRKEALEAGL